MTQSLSVAGLILAAGQSTRFGSNKLIEPVLGEALIRKTVTSWLKSKISGLYVVIGHQGHDIVQALEGFDFETIANSRFEAGLASSLATGIEELQNKYDFVLIGLGDMPYVKSETMNSLIDAATLNRHNAKLWIPCFQDQRGNPVLWSRSAFPDLAALEGDQGGRQLFEKFETAMQQVPVQDPGILRDIDVKQDLEG